MARTIRTSRPNAALQWLRDNPSPADLRQRYPREWTRVQSEVESLLARSQTNEVRDYLMGVATAPRTRPGGRLAPAAERASNEARRQIAAHLLRDAILLSSSGATSGSVKFNRVNGLIAQRLLFKTGLERKPVSLWMFRTVWPFLTQRRFLMPLVQPQGIWCFYSRRLIRELTSLIDGRSCVEIAAGDGTLTRFLRNAGADIEATDDHSWCDSITFPSSVAREDAATALRKRQPEVVICSWPPAGNTFERRVFETRSVQLYVVIGSASQVSTGNWETYRQQRTFSMTERQDLAELLLPPEVAHGVLVFERRSQ